MSENSEHSPDDTETETKATEDVPDDSSKSETKLMMDQTDTALLEDEEMPTYISVSSISRRDDSSEIANAKQPENVPMEEEEHSPSPYHSDDQAASSVYVLSSGEETDHLPYNDEDDEDEYGDSDDMENLELDNDSDPNHLNLKHMLDEEDDDDDEEEEEEEEEENLRQINNDEIDDEYYDRISADVILNKGLKKRDKEKSSSLQDLSIYRNNMYDIDKKRHAALMKRNYLNIPQNNMMFSMVHRKQSVHQKYNHIQSKVKLYIQDIKEQNKRSSEKHTKEHEDTIQGKINTDYKNNDAEEAKSVVTNRTIKSYAVKTIKELEIADACEKDKVICNASPIILNGQDNKKNEVRSIQEEDIGAQVEIQVSAPFELIQSENDNINSDDKKQNGIAEIGFNEGETRQFNVTVEPSPVQNGHQGSPLVSPVFFNLQTLSYEEYMRGTSKSSQKTDLNQNAQVIEQGLIEPEIHNDAEPMDISKADNNGEIYPIRIEDIKHIDIIENERKNNDEKIAFDKVNETFSKTTSDNLEVITLKDQLNQKTIQYNNLRDTYQKQLAENLKMKQELEELRKSLAKYEKKNKPPAQKVACIQTDSITESAMQASLAKVTNKDCNQPQSINKKQHNNKVSGSSVFSTLSSIEQSDSVCNLSVSMKPPEVTKTLHSDDSIMLTDGTPRKNTRTLSHAFITSSRILQTLSNITQGKTKPESPLVQNSKKRLNESTMMELQNDNSSYQSRPSSSKKRKISDILGPSSFLQNLKASQSSTESKLNETSNVERQFKYSYDSINEKSESQENLCNINTSQFETATSTESKTENTNDPEDNVKCFVYHENENSTERSFLIQAEQPTKDKIVSEKTRTRECGPFLLGNVEVRMSEINGTINIWGKEINDESITENENEMETSTKGKNDKKCWQKTRFNGSNIVCSSSKKSKIPAKLEMSSATSNISCPHSMSFNNTPKPNSATCKVHADRACSPNVCVSTYEDCDTSKHHKEWLRYKRIHPEEKSHSCCAHNVEILGQKCNCFSHKEKQKFEDSCNCSKEKNTVKEQRQGVSSNSTSTKHLHENFNPVTEDNEIACGYHTSCHHSLHNPREDCLQDHKHCNTSMETSLCDQLKLNTDQECSNGTCNYHSSNINEEEPLITHKQFSETPETRRRRLNGKRVRNILMDFLRGCGDCYNSNAPSTSRNCSHKKEVPYSTSCSPQIKISPCTSAEPSSLNPGPSSGRCCHAYAQRIESQLEEFRVEMERVRSRSDAIFNMLNMLHSMDTN